MSTGHPSFAPPCVHLAANQMCWSHIVGTLRHKGNSGHWHDAEVKVHGDKLVLTYAAFLLGTSFYCSMGRGGGTMGLFDGTAGFDMR